MKRLTRSRRWEAARQHLPQISDYSLRRNGASNETKRWVRKSVLTTCKSPSSVHFRIACESLKRGKRRLGTRTARRTKRRLRVTIAVNGTANWCSKGPARGPMGMSDVCTLIGITKATSSFKSERITYLLVPHIDKKKQMQNLDIFSLSLIRILIKFIKIRIKFFYDILF